MAFGGRDRSVFQQASGCLAHSLMIPADYMSVGKGQPAVVAGMNDGI